MHASILLHIGSNVAQVFRLCAKQIANNDGPELEDHSINTTNTCTESSVSCRPMFHQETHISNTTCPLQETKKCREFDTAQR